MTFGINAVGIITLGNNGTRQNGTWCISTSITILNILTLVILIIDMMTTSLMTQGIVRHNATVNSIPKVIMLNVVMKIVVAPTTRLPFNRLFAFKLNLRGVCAIKH